MFGLHGQTHFYSFKVEVDNSGEFHSQVVKYQVVIQTEPTQNVRIWRPQLYIFSRIVFFIFKQVV